MYVIFVFCWDVSPVDRVDVRIFADYRENRTEALDAHSCFGRAPAPPANEITDYLSGRYISTSEAVWRFLSYPLRSGNPRVDFIFFFCHHNDPSVLRLIVHLPGEHTVVFDEREDLEDIVDRAEQTMLTAWLKYNAEHGTGTLSGRQFTYADFPHDFAYDAQSRTWRQRAAHNRGALGRVYFVSPRAGEKYYLRVLLHKIPGCTSWEDMRTVGGVLHDSFQEACVAYELLQDDGEWYRCLEEADSFMIRGKDLRVLFAIILDWNHPARPLPSGSAEVVFCFIFLCGF